MSVQPPPAATRADPQAPPAGASDLAVVSDAPVADDLAIAFASMASVLEDADAASYLEFRVHRSDKRSVSVCVQWMDRPTPHQLRRTAEETSVQLRGAAEYLQRVIDRVRALHSSEPGTDGYLWCRTCQQYAPCETFRALDAIN